MKFIRKNIKEIILFILIIFIGLFLRFHKLGEIPGGMYKDEAVTGYNAFSILETGKDEYGKAYPVAFRFFGSYSPPLYVYLTSFVMSFLGVNVFSVRFVSCLSGVLLILVVYLFLKTIFKDKNKYVPLIGALVFSISPWGIFFSRAGYEINLGFLLFSLGAYFLWIGLAKYKYLVLGFLTLSLSTYGAHTQRFLVPIFLLLYILIYKKILFNKKALKHTALGLFIAFVIQIPNIYLLFTPALWTKNSLFYSGVIRSQADKFGAVFPKFISYPLAFLREFFSQYLTYFSPRSLFFLEDPDFQRSAPELSVFYFWMVIPYLLGWYHVLVKKKEVFYKYLLLMLLVIPVPLALSSDPFSTQRGLSLLLPITILITIGMSKIIKKTGMKGLVILLPFCFLSLIFVWRSYFVLLPHERAKNWDYGIEELAQEIQKRPNEIFVIDQTRTGPVYAGLAFFLKYTSQEFHEELGMDIKNNYYNDTAFKSEYKFSNIETRGIDWERDIYEKQILVGDEYTISETQSKEHFLEKAFEIYDPTGNIVFSGFRTNPEQKCFDINNANVYCN